MDQGYENTIMELIIQGGNARSLALQAIQAARRKQKEQAAKLMEECEEAMLKAHEVQTALIREELEGRPAQMNLLAVHAQDHVMNAITVKDLASEIIEILLGSEEE